MARHRLETLLLVAAVQVYGAEAGATVDHLQCFGLKRPPPHAAAVVAVDTPGVGMALGCKMSQIAYLCIGATAEVLQSSVDPLLPITGPDVPGARLCYKLKCPKPHPGARELTDRFGTRTFQKLRPALACTPAVGSGSLPPSAANDSLECFKTKDPERLEATLALSTELEETESCTIGRGRLVCLPASLTPLEASGPVASPGDTPTQTTQHLCYPAACQRPHPADQMVTDRFGTWTLRKPRPRFVCTPAQPGPFVSTTTSTSTTTLSSSTTSTTQPETDPHLRCQRALEDGGFAYVDQLLEIIEGCSAPQAVGAIDSCVGAAPAREQLVPLRESWAAAVTAACEGIDVHSDLGYRTTCDGPRSGCAFDSAMLVAPGERNDLVDCLTCRVETAVREAVRSVFANAPPTAACHQALGNGGFAALRALLQTGRTCLRQAGSPSIAACVTPDHASWRASVVAACGSINPFVTYGYPALCAGVAPASPAYCVDNVPPCAFASMSTLSGDGPDNDLVDCLECRSEEGVLGVLRALAGAELCCTGDHCDTVRTRYGCHAIGGTPVQYRIDTVPGLSVGGPHGIDVADDGTLYIADSGYARVVKRTAGGVVSVVGSTPGFPTGVAADAAGNVYVTNRCLHQVRKITPNGDVSVFAGTGTAGHAGDGGLATAAQTVAVDGITVDAAGNVYFTESGLLGFICGTGIGNADTVRMVDVNGIIHTVAGSGPVGLANPDGPALEANLFLPYGLHIGPSGDLFIGEAGGERVFRFTPGTGQIRWIAGRPLGPVASFSGDAGPARSMRFYENCGADEDADGNVFVGPMSDNRVVLVDQAGSALVIAGDGSGSGTLEGSPATLTAMGCPEDVAVAPDGRVYVSDLLSSSIKVLTRIPF